MRLEIDWTRCDGHGLCARLLPERISLDEHGFPVLPVRDIDEPLLAHARRAVAVCPRLALRLERSPTTSPPNPQPTPQPTPQPASHTVR